MKKRLLPMLLAIALFALGFTVRDLTSLWSSAFAVMAQQPETGAVNYLYIQELELGDRMTPNEYFSEATKLAKAIRATGEYKTVRVFNHNTGPNLSVYIFMEPKSWQAIETGASKWIESAGLLDKPWLWKSHSDNVLTELSVE